MNHHFNWSELWQWIGLNGGAVAWSAHYQWLEFVPAPDHIFEWVVGVLVGLSLMSLNATKLYYMIADKRKENAARKRHASRRKPRQDV